MLPDELAGKLLKHIYAYVNDENPVSDNQLVNLAFEPIKLQLKRDLVKWSETRESRSKAGKASAEARRNKPQHNSTILTHVDFVQQTPTNSTVNVNDNVNVNVTVNDNVSVKDKFIKPTLDEFMECFKDICKSDNLKFSDYQFSVKAKYESWVDNGWKDGNGKKIKNWKTKLKNVIPYLKPMQQQTQTDNQPVIKYQRF